MYHCFKENRSFLWFGKSYKLCKMYDCPVTSHTSDRAKSNCRFYHVPATVRITKWLITFKNWYTSYLIFCVLIAVLLSFTDLAPKLLKLSNAEYLLSEVLSQNPLEWYFSCQCRCGGSNENPTAYQIPYMYSAATLVQQRSMYYDLKTINVQGDQHTYILDVVSQPLRR